MRPKKIYFAYPYTSDPIERTKEVKKKIQELIKVRKDIVPFVPHLMFDELLDLPAGYDCQFVLGWEYEVIASMDYFYVIPHPKEIATAGIYWESEFARRVDVPRVSWIHLMTGGKV